MGKFDFDIAVIGGGAAGFFAAIHAARSGQNKVVILEKTSKLLQKVKVSGGGRCNLTHSCFSISKLIKHYPRGGKKLRKAFEQFSVQDTINWFESKGVKLKTEEDGRMFPVSDNSQTIIDCLLREATKAGVKVMIKHEVSEIIPAKGSFLLKIKGFDTLTTQKVIVTSGGNNKADAYNWLKKLGIKTAEPVPSLFTFNVPASEFKELMGLSVLNGSIQIPGTKLKETGPVLITHWGFSGPAVIKLSAWAAIELNKLNYNFPVLINWSGKSEEEVRQNLKIYAETHPSKQIFKNRLFEIPLRLWQKLCEKAGISENQIFSEISKKKNNLLVEHLVRSHFNVKGKTTFKEEFVTSGGVELSEVSLEKFESLKIQGLFFAGEVLNVDGLTGGFNFQHAWTSGYLAGKSAAIDCRAAFSIPDQKGEV